MDYTAFFGVHLGYIVTIKIVVSGRITILEKKGKKIEIPLWSNLGPNLHVQMGRRLDHRYQQSLSNFRASDLIFMRPTYAS